MNSKIRSLPLVIGLLASHLIWAGDSSMMREQSLLRRPIALAILDHGQTLLSANRASGTVSLLDAGAMRVVEELEIGRQLSDMALCPDQRTILITDEAAGELISLTRQDRKLSVAARVPVSPYPVRVTVSANGSRAYVASLWPRTLTIVPLPLLPGGEEIRSLALPFSPRELLLVRDDSKLIVGDAFAGRLAIVDTRTATIDFVREMPAHNIRGLAVSPDGKKLLVAHQILNDLAETSHNDVHWGVLMSNVLRWLVLDNVLDPQASILAGSHVHLTGDSNTPGADPAGIAMNAQGIAIVALAGDHEIGMCQEDDYALFRLPVGRRPTRLAISPDGQTCYVANTFSDTITSIALQPKLVPPARVVRDVRLGPQPELTQAQRGEMLFYDATLSLDGWFSCHSCHTDGHSIGLLNDNQGDGSFGAAKRILSLLGVSRTSPWAWNGNMHDLKTQVLKSIKTTMQGPDPSEEQVAALTAYLQTLQPPPAIGTFDTAADGEAVARGKAVFEKQQCGMCHAPPTYTSAATYDVNLPDKFGQREFNPPSLLGVGHRDRLFHDNRAANLEDVFRTHRHQLQGELKAQELSDLTAFLRSL
jgi:DNA-binding beta-propeller fold protein YncE